jgi:hypothetical protein
LRPSPCRRPHVLTVEEDSIEFTGTWTKSPTSVTVTYDGYDFVFRYVRTTGYSGTVPVIGLPVTLVSGTPCRPTTLPLP